MPTTELRAEWAAQRIKDLSFTSRREAALPRQQGERIKTLIERVPLPAARPGPDVGEDGRRDHRQRRRGPPRRARSTRARTCATAGSPRSRPAASGSSSPRHLLAPAARDRRRRRRGRRRRGAGRGRRPALPRLPHRRAGGRRRATCSPTTGSTSTSPACKVGRIQNFRAWSPWMVPDQRRPASASSTSASRATSCGDGRRRARRAGRRELAELGLVDAEQVERGFVIRVPKAYPIYDAEYADRVETIRGWLEGFSNLQQVGRNGLHRYNNSDHSMLTAMRAVENICDGRGHDIWAVNADTVYHEEDVRRPSSPTARCPRRATTARAARGGRRVHAQRADSSSSGRTPICTPGALGTLTAVWRAYGRGL